MVLFRQTQLRMEILLRLKMLENLLKNNPSILKLLSLIFRLFIEIVDKILPLYKKVLLVSYAGKRIDGSPIIVAELAIPKDYKLIIAVRDNVKRNKKYNYVKYSSLRYFWELITAKIWISNVNIELGLSLKRYSQIYINTWHGIPFVKIGNCVSRRNDYDFSKVDLITTCSSYDENIFKDCFNANPLSFVRCGLPRNIDLLDYNKEVVREGMNISKDKNVYLYAPTWRFDKKRSSEIYSNLIKYWEKNIKDDNLLLICKFHHLSEFEYIDILPANITIESNHISLNSCMQVSDFLITDYSSMYFDFSLMRKPTIFYMPDVDLYQQERGFYMKPNNNHGKIISSLKELNDIIYNPEVFNLKELNNFHEYDSFDSIMKIKTKINKLLCIE